MFGFLKKALGKRSAETPDFKGVLATAAVSLSTSVGATPVGPASTPAPLPRNVEPRVGASAPRIKGRMERLLLNLKPIVDRFPADVRAVIAQPPAPGVIVAIPVEVVLDQLSKGRVQIAIGDLRRVAPIHVFAADTSRDAEQVEIPLAEILPRIDPSLLARNNRRKVELPEDVEGVFEHSVKGKPAWTARSPDVPEASEPEALAPEPALPEASSTQEAASPPIEPDPPVAQPSDGPENRPLTAPEDLRVLLSQISRTTKSAYPVSPPEKRPEASTPGLKLRLDSEYSPSAAEPPAPAEPPPPEVVIPESLPEAPIDVPEAPISVPEPAPVESMESAGFPVTAPVSARPPSADSPAPPPAEAGVTVAVPVSQVQSGWPEGIRDEVAALLPEAVIHFPIKELGAALKCGLVSFPWRQLRGWITPAVPGETMYDVAVVSIPVPVVAPLFMGATRQAHTGRRVEVPENIPAMFVAEAKIAAPVSAPAPDAPAVEAVLADKPVDAPAFGGRIPTEIVNRACALNGVAGAIVASCEGLLVAAKLPPELQPETLAAFLPQVFSRLEQAIEPMRIGDLKSLVFTTDDRPWQILRTGTLFFATMGRPNELLPNAQLKMLAGQLARQFKL